MNLKKPLSLIKKTLPWLATIGIFAFLFTKYPPQKVWQALTYVQPLHFALYAIVYFLLILVFENYSTVWVTRRFLTPVTFLEILPGRLASYLPGIINYMAGQAAFAYFLKKKKQTSFFKSLSTVMIVIGIDLFWVVFFGFLGSLLVEIDFEFQSKQVSLNRWIQTAAVLFFTAALLHLLFWRGGVFGGFEKKIKFRFFHWLRERHVLQTFKEATLADYAKLALLRLPLHLVIISSTYIAVSAFRAHIPFFDILTTTPVVIWIGTIPLTPGGMGTMQAATVALLKDHVQSPLFETGVLNPAETLFAMSLAWMFANYFLKAILGSLVLKRLGRELFHQ